jgi:hypothetical protein
MLGVRQSCAKIATFKSKSHRRVAASRLRPRFSLRWPFELSRRGMPHVLYCSCQCAPWSAGRSQLSKRGPIACCRYVGLRRCGLWPVLSCNGSNGTTRSLSAKAYSCRSPEQAFCSTDTGGREKGWVVRACQFLRGGYANCEWRKIQPQRIDCCSSDAAIRHAVACHKHHQRPFCRRSS